MERLQSYTRWLPLLLVAAGVVVYSNSLDAPFIFDSEGAIKGDERALDLHKALAESPASMFTLHGNDPRPLVTISFAVNHAVDGLRTPGYQAFNIAIHILTALALYGVVRRTLLLSHWKDRFEKSAPWYALVVALIWVVHPLNTQAVTYTVQRAESMMALCFLVAVYAAIRQWEAKTAGAWGWAIVCVLAALLGSWCKQVIVALPVVLLAYDWAMLRPASFAAWARRHAGLIVALFAVSGWLFARSLGIATDEKSSAGFGLPVVTPLGYLMSQCHVVLYYLGLALWPKTLLLDYFWMPAVPIDTPANMVTTLFVKRALPYILVTGALFAAGAYGLARRKWWGFCAMAFFLILAPTSSIMPIADLAVEHRMYLPLACVVALAVFGASALLRLAAADRAVAIGAALVVLVTAALGARTFIRNYDYASSVRIWDENVVANPKNPRAWQNLGAMLLQAGDREQALFCFEQVLAILPNYAAAHGGMGDIYLEANQPDRAIEHYRAAVEIEPDKAGFHYDLGRALLMLNQFDESRAELLKAIELQPKYPKAYNNLGLSYLPGGDTDKAIAAFRTSIEQDPSQTDAYVNLSVTYEKLGDTANAVAVMDEAQSHERDSELKESQLERFNRRLRDLAQKASPAPAAP